MKWFECSDAVRDAKETLEVADRFVNDMARIICGRLRNAHVSYHTLGTLKKELRNFNIQTGGWK